MLTAFQCERVAYIGDGEVFCRDCTLANIAEAEELELDALREEVDALDWVADDQRLEDAGYSAVIRYTADEQWPEGLNCGRCSAEIVEANEDYCTEHDAWRAYQRGASRRWCEAATAPHRGIEVDIEVARTCRFPKLEDVDPNPPVPRWVPCSGCGARDGEAHREGCEQLAARRVS